MRWNISAALKRLSPMTFAPAGSTASCAAIFITRRSRHSQASSIITTATGLKAAPLLSKMRGDIWRFSAGQTRAYDPSQFRPNTQPTNCRKPFQPEIDHMTGAGSWLAPASSSDADEHSLRLLILTAAWAPQGNGDR